MDLSAFVRLSIIALFPLAAIGQDLPAHLPEIRYHLTARPWKPLAIPREAYLDVIEGVCRFTIRHQDERGAVIDAFLRREHQYSTPYFAFAVGVLAEAGRAPDLLPHGVRAMEHATSCFAGGAATIPDQHGEFFIPSLTGALELYRRHVPPDTYARWRKRLETPIDRVWEGEREHINNWRTYAMKGEWLRHGPAAVPFILKHWLGGQRDRIVRDKWNLYQDHSSDPESHAVEAVGRGNLIAIMDTLPEIAAAVTRGTRVSLLLQDPSGQCPMNGRTDDHVFNDVLYQLAFEVMAERERERDPWLAGQYRRAAMLSFQSIHRWRRDDAGWAGSFYVTKNKFNPADRIGYQPASNYGNYNGAVMIHLGEAWLERKHEIAERPAPVEIGGYALAADPGFASAFANAGGMQMAANLRGDIIGRYGIYWTALGVVRFGRPGWDTRLGPSDGVRDSYTCRGASFAPTWQRGKEWVRLADVPKDYEGEFQATFAHPLLVRCRIRWRPRGKDSGPAFHQDFVVTPDGILATSDSPAVTLPLLENDGTPLIKRIGGRIASTCYPGSPDEQNFIALDDTATLDASEAPVQSTYGWLRPVRCTSRRVFVYPRTAGDPPAESVRDSFRLTAQGFQSVLGRVEGDLYIGHTSAGGAGDRIDLDGDGSADLRFSSPCGFLLQLDNGRVTAIETDRAVSATIGGRSIRLSPFSPRTL